MHFSQQKTFFSTRLFPCSSLAYQIASAGSRNGLVFALPQFSQGKKRGKARSISETTGLSLRSIVSPPGVLLERTGEERERYQEKIAVDSPYTVGADDPVGYPENSKRVSAGEEVGSPCLLWEVPHIQNLFAC